MANFDFQKGVNALVSGSKYAKSANRAYGYPVIVAVDGDYIKCGHEFGKAVADGIGSDVAFKSKHYRFAVCPADGATVENVRMLVASALCATSVCFEGEYEYTRQMEIKAAAKASATSPASSPSVVDPAPVVAPVAATVQPSDNSTAVDVPAFELPALPPNLACFSAMPDFNGWHKNAESKANEYSKKVLAAATAKPTEVVHRITLPDGRSTTVKGVVPVMFEKTLQVTAAQNKLNRAAYLVGPAGTGKSTLCKMVADSLGVALYTESKLEGKWDLEGILNAGNIYNESLFFHAFTEGGVYFLDEFDACAPDVAVALNGALQSRRFTFYAKNENGAYVKKEFQAHENFYFIAAGNTFGYGADLTYNGRNQLDAATLNRFIPLTVDYDPQIEEMIAENDPELLEFIRGLRGAVRSMGLPGFIVSYREIENFKAWRGVWSDAECVNYFIVRGFDNKTIREICSHMTVNPSNKLFKTLKTFA